MARPQSYVNRNGKKVKTVTGVSFHKATRRFYVIDEGGSRQYFAAWEDARVTYVAQERERMSQEERAINDAKLAVRAAALMDRLRQAGRESDADDVLFDQVAERIIREGEPAKAAVYEKLDRMATAEGVPRYDVTPHRPKAKAAPAGGRPTLKVMLERWIEGKTLEGVGDQHRRETAIRFREFIKTAGDKTIDALRARDKISDAIEAASPILPV